MTVIDIDMIFFALKDINRRLVNGFKIEFFDTNEVIDISLDNSANEKHLQISK